MTLLIIHDSWTSTCFSLKWLQHYMTISTSSYDEDMTCHYLWWLGLWVTDEMESLQWWNGYHLCLHSSYNFQSLMSSHFKGNLILEFVRFFDHQASNVFFIFTMLPLLYLFSRYYSFVISMLFLRYMCLQSLMTRNHQPKNIYYNMFYAYFLFIPFQCT